MEPVFVSNFLECPSRLKRIMLAKYVIFIKASPWIFCSNHCLGAITVNLIPCVLSEKEILALKMVNDY